MSSKHVAKRKSPEDIFDDMNRSFKQQANSLQRSAADVLDYIESIVKNWISANDKLSEYLSTLPTNQREPAFKKMHKIWQRHMIERKLKFFEKGFIQMLEDDCQFCLSKCFLVMQSVEMGLANIPSMFGDFIKREAILAISGLSGIDHLDFQDFVTNLLALRNYFSKMAENCFLRDESMFMAVLTAFHSVLNNKDEPTKARGPKLLAMYWDSCLKKKNAAIESGNLIPASLKLCAVLYNGPEYAEENFKLLFHRLINDCCNYDNLELGLLKMLIAALNAPNNDLLGRGKRALEDITFKFSLDEAYQLYKKKCKTHAIDGVSATFLLLQDQLWTHVALLDYESECVLPDFCEASITHFTKFWTVYTKGKSLKWMLHLSTAEVDIHLSETPCTVRVTLFGVAILYCFQDRDEMSLQLIKEKTRMKPFVLIQEAMLLIDFGLLYKSTSGKLTMSAILTLNRKFPEERIRSGVFFSGEKNLEVERQAYKRLKLTAVRKIDRAAQCKERRKKEHLELRHPKMTLNQISVPDEAHTPAPPEPNFTLSSTLSAHGPTAAGDSQTVHATESVKSVPSVDAEISENMKKKSAVKQPVKKNIGAKIGEPKVVPQHDPSRKPLHETRSIPSEPNDSYVGDPIGKRETNLQETLNAFHDLSISNVIVPTVMLESLTTIVEKGSDINKASENRIQTSTGTVKKCSEVNIANPKALHEEIPQKSRGAIPKVSKPAGEECNTLTAEKASKNVSSDEMIACELDGPNLVLEVNEMFDIFNELRLGKNVFVTYSAESLWLRDVLDIPLDDEVSLEFCRKNLEKHVVLVSMSFLELLAQQERELTEESGEEEQLSEPFANIKTKLQETLDAFRDLSKSNEKVPTETLKRELTGEAGEDEQLFVSEPIAKIKTNLQETLDAFHDLSISNVIVPPVTLKSLTTILEKSLDINVASEARIQNSTGAAKNVSSDEELACELAETTLTLDVNELINIFNELCLGKNVFVKNSAESIWLRDVLEIPLEDEISLEFCRKNLEKHAVLVSISLLALLSPQVREITAKLEEEERRGRDQREIPHHHYVTPSIQRAKCVFQENLPETVCIATQLEDLPGNSELKPKRNCEVRQRENYRSKPNIQNENLAGDSNVTPPKSFSLPSAKTCESENHIPYSKIFQPLAASRFSKPKSSKSKSRKETKFMDSVSENRTADKITHTDPCANSLIIEGNKHKTRSESSIFTKECALLDNTPSAPYWSEDEPLPKETQKNCCEPFCHSSHSRQKPQYFEEGNSESRKSVEVFRNEEPYSEDVASNSSLPITTLHLEGSEICFPGMPWDALPCPMVRRRHPILQKKPLAEGESVAESNKIQAIEKIQVNEIPSIEKIPAIEKTPVIVSLVPQALGNYPSTNPPEKGATAMENSEKVDTSTMDEDLAVKTTSEPPEIRYPVLGLSLLGSCVMRKCCIFKKCGSPRKRSAAGGGSAPAKYFPSSKRGIFAKISKLIKISTLSNSSVSEKKSTLSEKFTCTKVSSPSSPLTPVEKTMFSSADSSSTVKSFEVAARDSVAAFPWPSAPENVIPCPVCDETTCPTALLRRRPQHPRVQELKRERI